MVSVQIELGKNAKERLLIKTVEQIASEIQPRFTERITVEPLLSGGYSGMNTHKFRSLDGNEFITPPCIYLQKEKQERVFFGLIPFTFESPLCAVDFSLNYMEAYGKPHMRAIVIDPSIENTVIKHLKQYADLVNVNLNIRVGM